MASSLQSNNTLNDESVNTVQLPAPIYALAPPQEFRSNNWDIVYRLCNQNQVINVMVPNYLNSFSGQLYLQVRILSENLIDYHPLYKPVSTKVTINKDRKYSLGEKQLGYHINYLPYISSEDISNDLHNSLCVYQLVQPKDFVLELLDLEVFITSRFAGKCIMRTNPQTKIIYISIRWCLKTSPTQIIDVSPANNFLTRYKQTSPYTKSNQ